MYNLIEYSDNDAMKNLEVCGNITEINQMII